MTNRDSRILAIVVPVFALAIVALAIMLGPGDAQPHHAPTPRLAQCETEDACAIDYRASGWYLMECDGACDDDGARTTWRRLYVH